MSLRDIAKGIGIRAAILGVGGLIASGLLTAAILKAAGTLVKVFLGVILLVIGGGVATWELRKVQRSFEQNGRNSAKNTHI
jgi:predicted lipid-binding transport protein (Tim44 family)